MKRILAIFAHPDDETFACGGSLTKWVEEGAEITLLCATRGEAGRRMGDPPFTTREELPQVREAELRQACEVMGVQHLHFLDIKDKEVELHEPEPLTSILRDWMEQLKPDLIVTFGLLGRFNYHADHRAVSRCATEAFMSSSHPCMLYYPLFPAEWEKASELGLQQKDLVRIEITDTWEKKVTALQAHRTQMEQEKWLWQRDSARERIAMFEAFIPVIHPKLEK